MFVWVLIDAFLPPVPREVVVVGLAALSISPGVPHTWALALAAALGAIAGDNISYAIGRQIGVERWRWMTSPRGSLDGGSPSAPLHERLVVLWELGQALLAARHRHGALAAYDLHRGHRGRGTTGVARACPREPSPEGSRAHGGGEHGGRPPTRALT